MNLTESLPLPKKYEYIIYKFIQTIEEIYFIVPSSSFSRNNPPKLTTGKNYRVVCASET